MLGAIFTINIQQIAQITTAVVKKAQKKTIFVHLLYLAIKGDSDWILSGSICSGTRDKDVGGADLNQTQKNAGRPGFMSEKGVSKDHVFVYLHHQGTPVFLSIQFRF